MGHAFIRLSETALCWYDWIVQPYSPVITFAGGSVYTVLRTYPPFEFCDASDITNLLPLSFGTMNSGSTYHNGDHTGTRGGHSVDQVWIIDDATDTLTAHLAY